MSSDYADLLERGRLRYGVPPAESVAAVADLLRGLGAVSVDFERYRDDLVDEFVNSDLVEVAVTITDAGLLQQRATEEERERFETDLDDVFDPLEYGEEMVEWTTWSQEVSVLRRLLVLVERAPDDASKAGGFRVYGAGQWLRESLWAATGVVPRDPGAPSSSSDLFGDAFLSQGRGRFEAAPTRP